jgi:hypothetical protein
MQSIHTTLLQTQEALKFKEHSVFECEVLGGGGRGDRNMHIFQI